MICWQGTVNLPGGIKTMARPRKDISIDELIAKQEEAVSKSKAKYDTDVGKLKELYAKKDEIRRKEILKAIETSDKTFEEIMAFLQEEE